MFLLLGCLFWIDLFVWFICYGVCFAVRVVVGWGGLVCMIVYCEHPSGEYCYYIEWFCDLLC